MKILFIIFLFLILLVLVINSEFTNNDKKIINKVKGVINHFSNTIKSNDNKHITVAEKNGIITFLKSKLNYDDVLIPKDLTYEEYDNKLFFKNIKIIGIDYKNNIERKNSHNIDLIFTKNNDNMFLSQHYLYGDNGTFTINNLDENKELNMIPDILHITTEENFNQNIESDSELNTTESKDIIIPSLL